MARGAPRAQDAGPAAARTPRLPRGSAGLKLLLVCGLALLMSIPALFVFALLKDRTVRAEQVVQEVGETVGGPQTFIGPVLAVPFTIPSSDQSTGRGLFIVFPTDARAEAVTRTEVRRRSLFKVPVYQADLAFRSRFDLSGVAGEAPPGAVLHWDRAEFLVGVSDPRGAQADVAFTAAGEPRAVAPAASLSRTAVNGVDVVRPALGGRPPMDAGGLDFFGASAAGIAAPDARFEATARMRFSGAERLAVLAWGKTTGVQVKGDWPHPSFDGGFLPVRREVGENGFTATWRVPFVARGVPAQGTADTLAGLGQTALGVSFVEPGNPYQSVARSLKYALMFVGLVFLAYFLFETAQGRRVHPAQYVLVGLAQIVFYLLLLSIAEQVGFDLAFLIAAGATVGLISAYAGWVFESRRQGLVALAAFTLLYALIYVLMRLEDLALLVGAITSFAAIAAVMYFTRRIDWYGVTGSPEPQTSLKERP